jgi:hypothetical protein
MKSVGGQPANSEIGKYFFILFPVFEAKNVDE